MSAILLAGGRARRTGASPLGDANGLGAISDAAELLLDTCADEVVVVLGKRAAEAGRGLRPAPRMRVVVDPARSDRDRDLLRVGLEAANPDSTAYLVHRTDSAPIGAATVDRLLASFLQGRRPIAVVVNGVGLDHPVFVARSLRDELLESNDEGWLRALIARDPARFLVLRVDTRGAVRLIAGPGTRPTLPAHRGSASE